MYDGRNALELAREATSWVEAYLREAIVAAGLDPDERVNSKQFLRRQAEEKDPSDEKPPTSPLYNPDIVELLTGKKTSGGPVDNAKTDDEAKP